MVGEALPEMGIRRQKTSSACARRDRLETLNSCLQTVPTIVELAHSYRMLTSFSLFTWGRKFYLQERYLMLPGVLLANK